VSFRSLTDELWEGQKGLCWYCKQPMTRQRPFFKGVPEDSMMTKDHVMPHARGGRGRENFVLACYRCNQLKADTIPGNDEKKRVRRGGEEYVDLGGYQGWIWAGSPGNRDDDPPPDGMGT
jgi:5-methylcytosine-specific restriction endonuclease McrA